MITVAITTYPNYYKYLPMALASVDYDNAKILLINDGNTRLEFENVTTINRIKPDKWGTARARNLAWQNCETETIIYLDGDDFFFPGALAAMEWYYKDILTKTGERHVVYGNLIRSDMNTVWHTKPQYRGTDINLSPIHAKNSVMPYLCLIPVTYLEQIGGYDEVVPTWEDLIFEADLWANRIRATKMDIITYVYRWSQTGRRGSNDSSETRLTVQQYMYDRYAIKKE